MDRIQARRPDTPVLKFSSTGTQALNVEHVEQKVKDFFNMQAKRAITAKACA
jgi:hypothetical protein